MGVGKEYKVDIENFLDDIHIPESEAAIRKKLRVKSLNILEHSMY